MFEIIKAASRWRALPRIYLACQAGRRGSTPRRDPVCRLVTDVNLHRDP